MKLILELFKFKQPHLNKEDTQMHYVGMDAHISTLDFAVINDAGRLVKATKVNTSVNNLMQFIR